MTMQTGKSNQSTAKCHPAIWWDSKTGRTVQFFWLFTKYLTTKKKKIKFFPEKPQKPETLEKQGICPELFFLYILWKFRLYSRNIHIKDWLQTLSREVPSAYLLRSLFVSCSLKSYMQTQPVKKNDYYPYSTRDPAKRVTLHVLYTFNNHKRL